MCLTEYVSVYEKEKAMEKYCLKYWFLQHIQKSSKSVPSYSLNNFPSCYHPSLDQRYPGEDIKENFSIEEWG